MFFSLPSKPNKRISYICRPVASQPPAQLMNLWSVYHPEIPGFVREIAATPPLRRLMEVGMNCGCEYTSFSRFAHLEPYSRYDHSLGCALIVWHFSGDKRQAAAALLHDIATPAFAHVIDFLNGDHDRQESTEAGAADIIQACAELMEVLGRHGLSLDEVCDYHRYPLADNDTPRLSSDRLEYSLGNIVNYRIATRQEAASWYGHLVTGLNEEGIEELMFDDTAAALAFASGALKASRIYVADEDRFAMQMLAELLKKHIGRGVLSKEDLYTTEPQVIGLLEKDARAAADWQRFRAYRRMVPAAGQPQARRISAKKRHIDPYVKGKGRLSVISPFYSAQLRDFLALDFGQPVCGE